MGAFFVGDGALDVPLIKFFDFFTNFRNEQCSPVSFTANHLP